MLAKYACRIARKFKSLLVMNPLAQVGLAPPIIWEGRTCDQGCYFTIPGEGVNRLVFPWGAVIIRK